ncbi:MAG: hypothetical protein RIS45_1323 [Planctomycetota bacterium]|jgi:hypothetical protein
MYHYAGFHRHHMGRHYAGEAAAIERADRAESKLEKLKAKSEHLMTSVTNKAIVAGTAGAMGYYQGLKGSVPQVAGVGLDLIVGVAASGAALMADEIGLGKYGHYLDAVGTGSLAFYAANMGADLGMARAKKAAPPPPPPAADATAKGYSSYEPAAFAPHMNAPVEAGVPYGYR